MKKLNEITEKDIYCLAKKYYRKYHKAIDEFNDVRGTVYKYVLGKTDNVKADLISIFGKHYTLDYHSKSGTYCIDFDFISDVATENNECIIMKSDSWKSDVYVKLFVCDKTLKLVTTSYSKIIPFEIYNIIYTMILPQFFEDIEHITDTIKENLINVVKRNSRIDFGLIVDSNRSRTLFD